MAKRSLNDMRVRRHLRLRQKVKGTAQRPRLCVNRTLRHIHAQIIDDVKVLTRWFLTVTATSIMGPSKSLPKPRARLD
jgi:ribosomal protein L18